MLLLSLLVLLWQEEPATRQDLGTVEFRAGAAAATAQFLLVGSEPQVLLTLRNETDEILLWESAGSNCWSTHWIVEPIALDGSKVATAPGVIACGIRFGSWIPAHGQVERPFRPFSSDFGEEELAPPPPLDRWAWCYDFDLPRTRKTDSAQDIITCPLVFAWSVATGPRVFLGTNGDVHLDHFDPFAKRPFYAGLGPVPLAFGPLQGSANLRFAEGHSIVEWTLTNPLDRQIIWRPQAISDESGPVRLEILFQEQGDVFDAGQSRTYRWRIANESPVTADSAGTEVPRWHEIVNSTWPCAPDPGAEPSLLPARLHFYWDPELGFDAELEDAISVANDRNWKPYSHYREGWEMSASFSLASCQAVVTLRNWSGLADLTVFNRSKAPVYWLTSPADPTRWLLKPDGTTVPAAEPRQPEHWPGMQLVLDANALRETKIEPGSHREKRSPLSGLLWNESTFGETGDWDFNLPWSLIHGLALPQSAEPTDNRDFHRAWLRVSWDPDRAVDVSVSEAWPF